MKLHAGAGCSISPINILLCQRSTTSENWLRAEGISRPQLQRIFDPVYRQWNGSVLSDCPRAFHLLNLAVQASDKIERPVPDETARHDLLARLTQVERIAVSEPERVRRSSRLTREQPVRYRSREPVAALDAIEVKPGRFKPERLPAYLEFEFEPAAGIATWFCRDWRRTRT